jgi:plasmid stabilization system protein ParE
LPEACQDISDIADYLLANGGGDVAQRVVGGIREELGKIAKMPGLGHYRENLLDRDYRFWSVYSYVVAYRWNVTPIHIIAVVHGARDLEAFFRHRKRNLRG